jgi:hypothetical protein
MALDSQARAFLVGTREAIRLMSDGGRILAKVGEHGGEGRRAAVLVACHGSK